MGGSTGGGLSGDNDSAPTTRVAELLISLSSSTQPTLSSLLLEEETPFGRGLSTPASSSKTAPIDAGKVVVIDKADNSDSNMVPKEARCVDAAAASSASDLERGGVVLGGRGGGSKGDDEARLLGDGDA